MKIYSIYCHIINNKRYIGYTEKTITQRLEEHIKDSNKGSNTYFHRAIKKYGYDNIITEKLDECITRDAAKKKEMFYIEKYDTFNNGYNMTMGGDGGNTKERYTADQLQTWGKHRSILSSGMNNGNSRPDITLDDIVVVLCEFVKSEKKYGQYILRFEIDALLKDKLNISSMMLVNRGIKNHAELVQLVNSKLEITEHIKYDPYYRSKSMRNTLSIKSSNWGWVTDGRDNRRIELSKIDEYLKENNKYTRGRVLKK